MNQEMYLQKHNEDTYFFGIYALQVVTHWGHVIR